MRHLFSLVICCLLVVCAPLQAQTFDHLLTDYRKARDEGEVSHIFAIDNDTLLLNRNDGFYSSGLRYTRQYTLRDVQGALTYGWRIGQEIYTASDIKIPARFVRAPDHPYAGWLYGGFFRLSERADGTYTRAGIDVGCLGPCSGAEWTQTTFHRILNQPLPEGWDKQVRNEVGVVLYGEVAPVRWNLSQMVDMTPSLAFRFGNIFTDASADLTIRAGQLHVSHGMSSIHGFLRAGVQVVGHNASLQGGYFSSGNPHTVDPERVVGEAEIGVVWEQGQYGFAASVVRRGNEIRALPDSIGSQNYVHLQFFYTP